MAYSRGTQALLPIRTTAWLEKRRIPSESRPTLYVLTHKPLPVLPPRLNEVVRRVTMLGGFLARKGDGEPGVKTIWIGLQRVVDFAAGVRFMRESGDGTSFV